jgi:hypothetical protein
MGHPSKPCTECPWRRDVAPGRFPPERFELLASTAYDMSPVQFACHKSPEDREFACAGFLLRGSDHNFAVRRQRMRGEIGKVSDGGFPLFDSYREMAIANGVDPDHVILKRCR